MRSRCFLPDLVKSCAPLRNCNRAIPEISCIPQKGYRLICFIGRVFLNVYGCLFFNIRQNPQTSHIPRLQYIPKVVWTGMFPAGNFAVDSY